MRPAPPPPPPPGSNAPYYLDVSTVGSERTFVTCRIPAWDNTGQKKTRMMRLDDNGLQWVFFGDAEWNIHAMFSTVLPLRGAWAVGSGGMAGVFAAGDRSDYKVLPNLDNGELRGVRVIVGNVYVCGDQHQVFRAGPDRQFSRIDDGIFVPASKPGVVDRSWTDIDGTGPDNLYVVGKGGEIAHRDGQKWTRLKSPTKSDLHHILVRSTDEFYICGDNGVLLKGNHLGWTPLVPEGGAPFLSMTWFLDTLYVNTADTLFRLADNQLQPVPIRMPGYTGKPPIRKISAAGNSPLWVSTGTPLFLRFDGVVWAKAENPFPMQF